MQECLVWQMVPLRQAQTRSNRGPADLDESAWIDESEYCMIKIMIAHTYLCAAKMSGPVMITAQ